MIYCNLKGGLGNMFFQISAAKSLSIDLNTDCSFPNLYSNLHYLNAETTHNPNINHCLEYEQILGHLNTQPPQGFCPTVQYPFHYQLQSIPESDFIIDGFFQSEKYFIHNRDKILEFIKIPDSIQKTISEKYGNLLKLKTTSIHVRRGDYLKFSNYHAVQSIDYYLEAIDRLKNDTDIFVVFSDDIEWCKNNLKFKNLFFIQNEKDYIEIYLMSLCNNNITSNSSFSWWGGWLNNNSNKTVIGPKKWFGDAIHHYTGDIIPETWIKI